MTQHATRPLKVFVVDDTVTYRKILGEIVSKMPEAELSGTAPNGKIALSKLQYDPVDIILLNFDLPLGEGLALIEALRSQHPHSAIVITTLMKEIDRDVIIRGLEAGAIEFIQKAANGNAQANQEAITQKLTPIFKNYLANRPVSSEEETTALDEKTPSLIPVPIAETKVQPIAKPRFPRRPAKFKPALIAIGVSTGGPTALSEVLTRLPSSLGIPILVVQHMPALFTASFAKSLNARCHLTVKEAEAGELLATNTVYISPGGKHMLVKRLKETSEAEPPGLRISLNEEPPENSCRPSVDVLLRSIAAAEYADRCLVVIMTGMGSDGALGVQAVKQAGGYCITQSEASCVVYGMPRAVDDMGLSDERVDLDHLAERLLDFTCYLGGGGE